MKGLSDFNAIFSKVSVWALDFYAHEETFFRAGFPAVNDLHHNGVFLEF
jgi:hypothetical protein